jgi:hypothetical protein
MSVENLISSLGKGDNVSANKEFNSIMADKMTAAINAKKIEVASKIGKVSVEVQKEEELVNNEEG